MNDRDTLNRAELSLKFDDADATGGVFDSGQKNGYYEGENEKSLLTSLTSGGEVPVIPESYDGKWKSVLIAREPAPWWIRTLTINCCFQGTKFNLTRAQWLWFWNLLFAAAHVTLGVVFLANVGPDPEKNLVHVWKLARVTNSSRELGYGVEIVNNGWPVRIDFIVGGIFFVTALSHLFVTLAGPFDNYVRILWRQLDLGVSWWRWMEMSISYSLLVFLLALLCGLQEQVLLAVVFLLTWAGYMSVLLTEMYSRPVANADGKFDMMHYTGDARQFKVTNQGEQLMKDQQHRDNFKFRTQPTQLAFFLFGGAWTILIASWFQQMDDINERLDLGNITETWVALCVFLTLGFQILGIFVHIRYQRIPPGRRWEAEAAQYLIHAIPKVVVGSLVFVHILADGTTFSEALTLLNTTAVNISALDSTV